MNRKVLLFDLDGTITNEETLPVIAKTFNISDKINNITRDTLKGHIPFVESFIKRVNILKNYPVSEISLLLSKIKLSETILQFIKKNRNICYLVTGNLDCWIDLLCGNIGIKCFCSKAFVEDNKIIKIKKILLKDQVVNYFHNKNYEVVFIGDSNNDSEAMKLADFSIAYGGVHYPAHSVTSIADAIIFDDKELCRYLQQLL